MESILETLEKRRIRPSSDIRPHEFLYAWNGKPICARGELVAIGGKAKSGKTYVCSLLAALASSELLLGLSRNYTQGQTYTNAPLGGSTEGALQQGQTPRAIPDGAHSGVRPACYPSALPYKVLWIDTEQSEDSTQEILCGRIGALIGHEPDPEQYIVYNLRQENWQDRLPLVTTAICQHMPDLVIFDGIRDVVGDINDYQQAQEVIGTLLSIASFSNACIVCVLHQNKAIEDKTLRGAVGTELQNKSFETYECSKDPDTHIFTMKQTATRKYDITAKLTFTVDDAGLPQMCLAVENDADAKPARMPFNPEYVENGKINKPKLFAYILPEGKQMSWQQLRAVVMKVVHIESYHFADTFLHESIDESAIREIDLANGYKQYENAQQTKLVF